MNLRCPDNDDYIFVILPVPDCEVRRRFRISSPPSRKSLASYFSSRILFQNRLRRMNINP